MFVFCQTTLVAPPYHGCISTGRRLPTYAYDAVGWRRVNELLPSELRIDESTMPREEWMEVGRFRVHLDRHGPEDPPAMLVLVHGGGGNGRLFAPMGMRAARAGFGAVAADLPGYGLTQVPSKRNITSDDWREVLYAVLRAEAERGKPLVLFGGSLGGMLAYDGAAATRLPASLVATCLLDLRRPEVRRALFRSPVMAPVAQAALKLRPVADIVPVPLRWTANIRAIANGPCIADAISRDPQSGGNWMPGRWARSLLEWEPEVPPEEFDVCPVVLAHPAEDRWTDLRLSLPFFERIQRVENRLVMLEGAGHLPLEQPGRDQLAETVEAELRLAVATAGPA